MYCKKCCGSRTGDIIRAPCQTPGCDGIIEKEPLFQDQVDSLPGAMTCGRRFDTYVRNIPVHKDRGEGQDRWEKFKSNGNRVCSYCGSLHPDDMFELVRSSANASVDAPYRSVVEVEPSDKSYKIYVHQPGVRNAMEGGIKFYTQHLPRDTEGKLAVTDVQQEEYGRAVRNSHIRFEKMLGRKSA